MKPVPPQAITEPLTVVMRVRPMNGTEHKTGARSIVHPVDEKLIVLKDPHDDIDDILRANRSRERQYVFDHVFSCKASQEDVYCAVVQDKGIIESVLSGFNCTVFAYGATGTGKTHTMLGSHEEPGIMVHTLNSLFRKMEDTKHDMEYQVSMGYLEIYNECVRDLLCPDSGSLELREDASGSITVSNLLDISASSTDVILGMLRMGNTNRTSEPTVANKTSSRSHAILKVNVEQRSRVSNITQEVRSGSLYMVDLAGSERAAVTQNRGKRMIEGAHINRSLLALANCINALGSNNTNYVNYRDSKLTRILKEALGGNCKTVMIAHASPASSSYEETRNTMVYADRSKKIKNKTRQNVVDVNHHVTQYQQLIAELQYQVIRLRAELDKATECTAESSEVRGLCDELRSLTQDQREIRQQLLELECQLVQNALECQKHSTCIREWEQKRDAAMVDMSDPTTAPSVLSSSSPLFIPTTSKLTQGRVHQDDFNSTEAHHPEPEPLGSVISLKEAGLVVASTSHFTEVLSPLVGAAGVASPQMGVASPQTDMTSSQAGMTSPEMGVVSSRQTDMTSPQADVTSPQMDMTSNDKKSCISPAVPQEASDEDCLSSHHGLVDTGTDNCVLYKDHTKQKEPDITISNRFGKDLFPPVSPDSGTEMSVTVLAEKDQVVMEPVGVSAAREGVATLAVAKQRLNAQHQRLEKRLRENRSSVTRVRKRLLESNGFPAICKDMADLLQHVTELETTHMEHGLSSMLMGVHLSRHTSLLGQLLLHSATLLSMVEQQQQQQRAVLGEEGARGRRRGDVHVDELAWQCKQLSERQRKLAAEVSELQSLPDFGAKLQLPRISRLSAKLYSTMTGSKSNLIADEGLSDDDSSDTLSLPSILSPKHSTTQRPDKNIPDPTSASFSLPPVNPTHPSNLLVATKRPSPVAQQKNFLPSPLKQSELTLILEAAKKTRDDKMAATMGPDRFGRVRRNAKKRSVPHNKVSTFVSPRSSVKSKHVALPRHSMEFQPKVSLRSAHSRNTEVIDLEATDLSTSLNENPERNPIAADSASGTTTAALSQLQGQNTRSQPHLTTTTSQLPRAKAPHTQRLRRSRSHARIASLPFPEGTEQKESHAKSKSLEDVSSKQSSPIHKHEKKTVIDAKATANSSSRPIVKKLNYLKTKQAEKAHTQSVYSGRPYVVPAARRMAQHHLHRSPHRQAGNKISKKKAATSHLYAPLKKKHQILPRQELPLAKVKPGGQFSFPSPYVNSSSKQGGTKKPVTKLG